MNVFIAALLFQNEFCDLYLGINPSCHRKERDDAAVPQPSSLRGTGQKGRYLTNTSEH
jgi:hypothetical protein